MNRAYSLVEIKSLDDEKRIITGIATTPVTDRVGDIVEPKGAQFKLPLPLLWQHRGDSPIGHVTDAKITADGIEITAQIETMDEPGELKNLLDKAYHSIKKGLVRGLSIGFRPIESADIEGTWAQRFTKWEWLELSAVTIPANADATIQTVKQYDTDETASSTPGATGSVSNASGRVAVIKSTPKAKDKVKTIQEQKEGFNATRQAKLARLNELTQKAGTEGMTLDAAESEEFDTLQREIAEIDKHLARLQVTEDLNAKAAAPVPTAASSAAASNGRSATPPVVTVRPNTEKGIGFARYTMALMACKGNKFEAAEFAKARWGDQSHEVVAALKAAVAAGTTTDATWAAPLVPTTNLTNDFLELLRPATIIGKLADRFRRVPFNIAMPAQTAGGTYNWVGQGSAKPLTKADFATVTLGFAKAAGIIVLSEELVKFSNPNAEQVVRDEMIAGIGAFLDVQLTDPAVAAVANVNPASITNGVAGTAASGTTEAAARADLRALLGGFVTGNFGLGGVVLIMNEAIAFTLGTMVNAVGDQAFPGLTATGGSILGIPVVTSNAVSAATGIIAVHAPSILYADDGGVEIDMSREASLQMDSAPANPTTATEVMVSLWQRNLVGLRAERFINWKVARSGAVRRTHTVAYA